MSRFDEFLEKTAQDDAPKGRELDGTFMCQSCPEQVDAAEYYQAQKLLVWTCSQKHKSFIEGFCL